MTGRHPLRRAFLVLAVGFLASPCLALFGRTKLKSAKASGGAALDGRGAAWQDAEPFADSGLALRALNDGSNLYLLLSAENREGRGLLHGVAGQEIALWFMEAGGKKRAWGIAFVPEAGAGPGPRELESRKVSVEGVRVATSPVPADIEVAFERSERDPSVGLRIPLSSLSVEGGVVPADLVTGEADEETRRRFERMAAEGGPRGPFGNRGSGAPEEGGGGGPFGGRGGMSGDGPDDMGGGGPGGMGGGGPGGMGGGPRGMGGGRRGGMRGAGPGGGGRPTRDRAAPEPPKPLEFKLSVRLAK